MSPVTNVVPCRSCGARVRWLTHHATGRPAPIDAEPDPAGNVVPLPEGRYLVLSARALEQPGLLEDQPRHTSHFATCPEAAKWRGKGRAT